MLLSLIPVKFPPKKNENSATDFFALNSIEIQVGPLDVLAYI